MFHLEHFLNPSPNQSLLATPAALLGPPFESGTHTHTLVTPIKMATHSAILAKTRTRTHTLFSPIIKTYNNNNFLQPTKQLSNNKKSLSRIVFATTSTTNMGGEEDQKKNNEPQSYQNVVVMRHGDRIDNVDVMWAAKAARKWDPELVEGGKIRAFNTGRKLRNLGFPIHRVFVSPFLRCLQTAAEVVSALCADVDSDDNLLNFTKAADGIKIDPSKIKVSIEYGLCEMLNFAAIRPNVAPKDGNFGFDISQSESVLPAGTVDHDVERVYKELPKWQETVEGSRSRYVQIMKALADKYPSENLLLVTHGEGVGSVLSALIEGAEVYDVEYCAYLHTRRPIFSGENQPFAAGNFEVSSQTGLSSRNE